MTKLDKFVDFGYILCMKTLCKIYAPLPLYAIKVVVAALVPLTLAPVVPAKALIRAETAAGVVIFSSDIKYAARPATCGDAMYLLVTNLHNQISGSYSPMLVPLRTAVAVLLVIPTL